MKVETKPLTKQQIIEQWKLNHGLFLDGSSIQPSKKAVYGDGKLGIRLYKGAPIVYTNINDPHSVNSLSFDNKNVGTNESLKQSDVCIKFPVMDLTYKSDSFDESFGSFKGEDNDLHD